MFLKNTPIYTKKSKKCSQNLRDYTEILLKLYRVSHFKNCTEIFLQRSIFRKNVSDKSCLGRRGT